MLLYSSEWFQNNSFAINRWWKTIRRYCACISTRWLLTSEWYSCKKFWYINHWRRCSSSSRKRNVVHCTAAYTVRGVYTNEKQKSCGKHFVKTYSTDDGGVVRQYLGDVYCTRVYTLIYTSYTYIYYISAEIIIVR